MIAETGILLGLGVALVLFIIVRRIDRRQHQRKLKAIQDRIARSEQDAEQRRRDAEDSRDDQERTP